MYISATVSSVSKLLSILRENSTSLRSAAWRPVHRCSPRCFHSTCQCPSNLWISPRPPWDKYSVGHHTKPDGSALPGPKGEQES